MTEDEYLEKKRESQERALSILRKWNEVTGCFMTEGSYWAEIQGIIEDAVECGWQGNANIYYKLDSEEQ